MRRERQIKRLPRARKLALAPKRTKPVRSKQKRAAKTV
jgi:predicted GIY-YIG superfamily endonuclease